MLRHALPTLRALPARARAPLAPLAPLAFSRPMSIGRAGETLDEWIAEITSKPATLSTDMISAQRAEQLLRTLPSRARFSSAGSGIRELGGSLPNAYHLIYFQGEEWLGELGKDGTATEYNAPAPFDRRMWAGGMFEWNPDLNLKIGEEAVQSVRVGGVSVKNEKMMFVKQLREFRPASAPEGAWAVREERNHVFRPNEVATGEPKAKPPSSDMPEPDYSKAYTPSSPLLFRYSALTYNAHKIHYDLEWTREMEGHPDLVVHGPMTATLLIELAGQAAGDTAAFLSKFEYRATSPMYVNREVKLQAKWEERGKTLTLWAEQEGRVGMKATATLVPSMAV